MRLDFEAQFEATAAGPAGQKMVKQTQKAIAKARTRDSMQALGKLTEVVDGRRQIINQPPLIMRLEQMAEQREDLAALDVEKEVGGVLSGYRRTLPTDRRHLVDQYDYVDTALKVVGVGSVGTRAWIMLMLGRDSEDPLFLQAKEAQASVLERFTGRSEYHQAGERVVAGQRLMQSTSDIFLGLAPDREPGRRGVPRLLRAATAGLEGLGGGRRHRPRPAVHVRPDVRLDPGQGARPLR